MRGMSFRRGARNFTPDEWLAEAAPTNQIQPHLSPPEPGDTYPELGCRSGYSRHAAPTRKLPRSAGTHSVLATGSIVRKGSVLYPPGPSDPPRHSSQHEPPAVTAALSMTGSARVGLHYRKVVQSGGTEPYAGVGQPCSVTVAWGC